MAAKKNDGSENRIVKIKASVGAWWKSRTAEDEVQTEESQEKRQKEEKQEKKKKTGGGGRGRPRSTRGNKAGKTVSSASKAQQGDDQEQVSAAEVMSGTEELAASPENTKARRRTSKAKKSGMGPTSEKKATAPGETADAADSEQAADSPEKTADTEKEAGKTSSKRGRTSRGRRSRKKTKAPSQPEAGVEGEEENQEPTAEPAKEDTVEEKDDSSTASAPPPEPAEKVVQKLLINAEEPEECRLALLANGKLEEIHVSTVGRAQTKNNIYKAKIVALEPSLQAAFVDYGREKNGFLPFGEIHPEYYKANLPEEIKELVQQHQWKKLTITDVLERGQELLVQVVKEEVGKKGANMTTFLSIPGRCVVLMPGSDSAGISRKISGEERRNQLRETMRSVDIPEGIGWIVRTASVDITQEALTRDVNYLLKLWADIKKRGQEKNGVGLIYEDQDPVLRFLREHFDPEIEEILIDNKETLQQVKDFISLLPKEQQKVRVRLHQGARPIFNQYSVEDQIESIYQPQVNLPSGGSIVINPTEALVAIDVNSGSTSKGKNFEASIFQANMEAADELARQLRLRDLGGLIVVDFIDMRSRKNIQAVEKQVRLAMKKDKAKVDFSRISKFGLMQISRQKLGAPIEAGNYQRCEHCRGRGTVRSVETLSLYYLRRIQTGASRKPVEKVECRLPLEVASYLLNNKREEILDMEKRYRVAILITADPGMKPMDNELLFHKAEKDNTSQKES